MKSLGLISYALAGAASALLAGCGGSQLPSDANDTSAVTQVRSHQRTFQYDGSEQSFKVPAGVARVHIDAVGAQGAQGSPSYVGSGGPGGRGGSVKVTLRVTPGERLAIFVGGSGNKGGFNGGGGMSTCKSRPCYGDGGGASDVRQGGGKLADRVVVAAGGGGGGMDGGCTRGSCGYFTGGSGGNGGGHKGKSGGPGSGRVAGHGGTGGMQRIGGDGGAGGRNGSGCAGQDGQLGAGGYGSQGCGTIEYSGSPGGTGGGGYYGGGGGGGGAWQSRHHLFEPGGGGGGGSSFAKSGTTHVEMKAGVQNGDGVIYITW